MTQNPLIHILYPHFMSDPTKPRKKKSSLFPDGFVIPKGMRQQDFASPKLFQRAAMDQAKAAEIAGAPQGAENEFEEGRGATPIGFGLTTGKTGGGAFGAGRKIGASNIGKNSKKEFEAKEAERKAELKKAKDAADKKKKEKEEKQQDPQGGGGAGQGLRTGGLRTGGLSNDAGFGNRRRVGSRGY